jgi:hypothetical protein
MNPKLHQTKELLADMIANHRADLHEVSQTLKDMVDNHELENFSFRDNAKSGDWDNSKHYIFVSVNAGNNTTPQLLLGVSPDLVGFNLDNLSQGTIDKLDQINEYLEFINQHFPQDLPVLKKNTYYSFEADKNVDYWTSNKVQILPDFLEEENSTKFSPKM